jgi:hypothetical protein
MSSKTGIDRRDFIKLSSLATVSTTLYNNAFPGPLSVSSKSAAKPPPG